ncbi:hypothetical protein KI440_00815 [Candidatus Saccharibacteria bacterium TM7i]|nr:hypothetical protein KI440_00815 [Candidatus Saccharibacteria bacterium TM7i]
MNGLKSFEGKLCIGQYDRSNKGCYPDLVEGVVPEYDRQKIYISVSAVGIHGSPASGVNLNFLSWDADQGRWMGKNFTATTESLDSEDVFDGGRCTPGVEWDPSFDQECRYAKYEVT